MPTIKKKLVKDKAKTVPKPKKVSSVKRRKVVPSNKTKSSICPLPMLAQEFTKHGKKRIHYPAFTQPKVDGVRGIYHDGQLLSRQNNAFTSPIHILEELNDLSPPWPLDGELFTTKLTFQQIVGAVKRKTIRSRKGKSSKVQEDEISKIDYYIFDIVLPGKTFQERNVLLCKWYAANCKKCKHIVLVPTSTCDSTTCVEKHLTQQLKAGYEGLMIRNMDGMYECGKRSYDLLKYKKFEDAEYYIVGSEPSEDEKSIVWHCKTKDGSIFNAKQSGTNASQGKYLKSPKSYIGKLLTVKYQNLTDGGIPRFPVGISLRNYE
jgi:ATP-dependent DNA ligase